MCNYVGVEIVTNLQPDTTRNYPVHDIRVVFCPYRKRFR